MHFTKLASEVEVIRSTPVALGLGAEASMLMVAAGEHELYNDLDEKEKAQTLPDLPPTSEAPLVQEMLGGKEKGKAKASAAMKEEE
ncbi:hypothetical protein C0995_000957 [Termitomyces sp. Mi166|nr:hypothetical protein C0995_000957 [Termitomyces sp. Mi166\